MPTGPLRDASVRRNARCSRYFAYVCLLAALPGCFRLWTTSYWRICRFQIWPFCPRKCATTSPLFSAKFPLRLQTLPLWYCTKNVYITKATWFPIDTTYSIVIGPEHSPSLTTLRAVKIQLPRLHHCTVHLILPSSHSCTHAFTKARAVSSHNS